MVPRLRAAPRHGGAGKLIGDAPFCFSSHYQRKNPVIKPPLGALRGGGVNPKN
jgi:hypothetical protein